MSIYTKNHRKNLTLYWQQYYPSYEIPEGYHVHHIIPKSIGGTNHPTNLIALHPDDHASIHNCRGDISVGSGFLSVARCDMSKRALKGAETKRTTIGKDGLNTHQRANRQISMDKYNDIDENGINGHQRPALKVAQRKMNSLDENGLNEYQIAVAKGNVTKYNDIGEDGLNGFERANRQGAITKNKVGPDGLTGFQRAGIKSAITRLNKRKKKYPDLHNKDYFIKHCMFANGKLKVEDTLAAHSNQGLTWKMLNTIKQYHNL